MPTGIQERRGLQAATFAQIVLAGRRQQPGRRGVVEANRPPVTNSAEVGPTPAAGAISQAANGSSSSYRLVKRCPGLADYVSGTLWSPS